MRAPVPSGGHPLDPVFAPKCVAVVGASQDPAKRGHQILRALRESGYQGEVLPVNPRRGEILGLPVHPSVEALPRRPDLAVLCTPAAAAPDLVARCGAAGVRAAVVLAVGFGESGEEGRVLEERVLDAGRAHGVRLVGPNTSGILNLALGLNLIGARDVRPGSLSLLVQSGNMALALMTEATERSWEGIRICAGLGNARDVGFDECLDYLDRDPGTRAILCHLEGTGRMPSVLNAAAGVVRRKPVVLLKAGRSAAGAAAARSHTGAVSGSYDRLRTALRQVGVTEVRRTDELLHVGETLAWQPLPDPDTGVVILADGGGQGTLAADTLSEMGIPLARLADGTRSRLRSLLGTAAATGNPVDVAGAADSDPGVFAETLDILVTDPAVGGVLMVGLFGGYGVRFDAALAEAEEEASGRMARSAASARRGLVVHSIYALHRTPALARLGAARVPVIASLEVACRSVAELWNRSRYLAAPRWAPHGPHSPTSGPAGSPSPGPGGGAEEVEALPEPEARRLLEEAGLSFPPARLCTTAQEAVRAAEGLGGTVALKVVSSAIPHKSEAGGVILGLASPEAVADGFREITTRAAHHLGLQESGGTVDGVLVSAMEPPPLVELLVGAAADADLGFVVTLGAGGIWVEVLQDVTHRLAPLETGLVREMLRELRVGGMLAGGRGRAPGDVDGVAAAVLAVTRCITGNPRVTEVEVNPLFVYPDRVVPVDARVYVRRGSTRTTPSA